eukprot:11253563-Alexandrium_andersonii.AAC.1
MRHPPPCPPASSGPALRRWRCRSPGARGARPTNALGRGLCCLCTGAWRPGTPRGAFIFRRPASRSWALQPE